MKQLEPEYLDCLMMAFKWDYRRGMFYEGVIRNIIRAWAFFLLVLLATIASPFVLLFAILSPVYFLVTWLVGPFIAAMRMDMATYLKAKKIVTDEPEESN